MGDTMMFRAPFTTLLVAGTLFGITASSARADYLYWTDTLGYDSILSYDLVNGTGPPQTFYTPPGPAGPHGFALDSVNGHFYWSAGPNIGRINTNGTSPNNSVINRGTFEVTEIDVYNGGPNSKIYWTEKGAGNFQHIMRANLDGTGIQEFWPSDWNNARVPYGLDIDPVNGWVYWTSYSSTLPSIWRTNFSMSTTEAVVDYWSYPDAGRNDALPLGIVLDIEGINQGMMYWTEWSNVGGQGRIMKKSISDPVSVAPTVVYDPGNAFTPYGITLDAATDTLYFAVTDNIFGGAQNAIYKIGTDGTGLASVVIEPTMDFPAFLEFDSTASVIPEPSSLTLLGIALAGLAFRFRRKKV